jgi:acetyltransferase-like isoleucine patch superfamily enzyme
MKRLFELLRYDWPLHFVLMATNWLPDNVVFLRFRGRLARPFLGSCGRRLGISRNVTFHNPSQIRLGSDVFFAHGCMLMATTVIEIGDGVMFGPYCIVVSNNHTRTGDGSYRHGIPDLAPISIGAGTWVGSHVVVTAGSSIGQNVGIAAGAVVRGEIPANVVAGGMPARVLKAVGPGESV